MTVLRASDAADFTSESDRLGGVGSPACAAWWGGLSFDLAESTRLPDDPFSEGYVAGQVDLYQRLSGRELDQSSFERTTFDLETHVRTASPYANVPAAEVGTHVGRVAAAMVAAAPPGNGRLLDMGCGWGLSSEVCAYLGLRVTAVDIDPAFVELVRRRAAARGAAIEVHHSSFETFGSDTLFDVALFYECFHHSVRPWVVIERLKRLLSSRGAIVLAGEPFNDIWPYWGLRNDPLSIYCIRKFGWFESGWSKGFVQRMFDRCGFDSTFAPGWRGPGEQDVLVARPRVAETLDAAEMMARCAPAGFEHEGGNLLASSGGSIGRPDRLAGHEIRLRLVNFRPATLRVVLSDSDGERRPLVLEPGENEVRIGPDAGTVRYESETWRPADELDSGDGRTLAFHLQAMEVMA